VGVGHGSAKSSLLERMSFIQNIFAFWVTKEAPVAVSPSRNKFLQRKN